MPKYTNEDQRNLEEILEEGIWDRLKAKGAEALGSVKGLGQMAKGIGQGVVGTISNDPEIQKKSRESFQTGKKSGVNAKINYLKKNIEKRISDLISNIDNDVKKLGLKVVDIQFVDDLKNSLESLKSGDVQPPSLPQQTPPPLSQDEPKEEPLKFAADSPKSEKSSFTSKKDSIKKTNPRFMSAAARKRYEQEQAKKRSLSSKQSAVTKNKNQQSLQNNPKKGKIRKDPFAKYAAPEQEEDLDKMFWDN